MVFKVAFLAEGTGIALIPNELLLRKEISNWLLLKVNTPTLIKQYGSTV